MSQVLVIMQGVPGSGKSTVADALSAVYSVNQEVKTTNSETGLEGEPIPYWVPAYVFSTDDYFYNEKGMYNYKKEEIGRAHEWNQARVEFELRRGSSVIVDNTNIKAWQARPYVEMAQALNIPIIFIRVSGHIWGNIHGVPEEVVNRMVSDMELLTVESCLQAAYPWEQKDAVHEKTG